MRRPHLLSVVLALWLCGPLAILAQNFVPSRGSREPPPSILFDEFKYGPTGHDSADILGYRLPGHPPVVISFPSHDALSEKSRLETDWLPSFLFDNGFALARVWDRHERDISGRDFAAAMATAVAEIVERARSAGFDGSRLILMGKGWGGQVAALLATDPSYLEAVGVDFDSVRGAFILDGRGFDLPAYSAAASDYRKKQLKKLVGNRDGALAELSPMHFAEAPNAPRFLFYAIQSDADAVAEAEAMSAAIVEAGGRSEVKSVGETKWTAPASYPGNPRNPDNDALLRFLRAATESPPPSE